MAGFYGNVGIWTGTFGSIPLVIEVTSLKKPYIQTTTAVAGQSCAPVATVFSGEIDRAPRSWTERSYHKLSYSTRSTKVVTSRRGEPPEVFSDEIRAAFRSVR